jgi:hypothetical protein
MKVDQLIARYDGGAITAEHLFAECLHAVDPASPGLTLDDLPDQLVGRFRRFVDEYRPGQMVTNYGALPTADQVEAARRWLGQPERLARSGTR